MMAISSPSSVLFQDLVGQFYSRRLLLLSPSNQSPALPPSNGRSSSSSLDYGSDNSFDSNVVMVLSVLLCALICSLGLNSIIRCALRCSTFVSSNSSGGSSGTSARLANTGVKRKALKMFPVVSYSSELNLPGLATECVICLSEFAMGERIRLLPKCHHGFHVRCIDKWLSSHSSCPTCRHCLIETCQKIVSGCSTSSTQASSSHYPSPVPLPPPPPPIQISIAPLEPEGFVRNYHGAS